MHPGIFVSCTSGHYQPALTLVCWRKLVLTYPSIAGKKGHLPSKLFDCFVLCSILSMIAIGKRFTDLIISH